MRILARLFIKRYIVWVDQMCEYIIEDEWADTETSQDNTRNKTLIVRKPEPAVMHRNHVDYSLIDWKAKDIHDHEAGVLVDTHERWAEKQWKSYAGTQHHKQPWIPVPLHHGSTDWHEKDVDG